jgi:hypothetical protein
MARQTGIIQLSGPLGGISFYRHKKYGMLARACNPVSAQRIAKDPAFARTRENGTEFGMASRAGKLLRQGLLGFLRDVPTEELDLRVMRLMMDIKTQDTVSQRGQRQVGIALGLQPGLLGGFALSGSCGTDRFLVHAPVVDVAQGTIVLPDLRFDHVPKQATHAVVTGFRGKIDFGKGEQDFVFSECVTIPIEFPVATAAIAPIVNRGAATLRGGSPFDTEGRNSELLPSRDVVLRLPAPVADTLPESSDSPALRGPATGIEMWGLKIVFLQEVNGIKYTLKTGASGILSSNSIQVTGDPEAALLREIKHVLAGVAPHISKVQGEKTLGRKDGFQADDG